MKKQYLLYLSLILTAASLNTLAEQSVQIGLIDNFYGARTDYIIQRGKRSIPMGVYEPLYPGDRIKMGGAHRQHFVEIRECGKVYRVIQADFPYTIQPTVQCKVIGWGDNILLVLKEFAKYVFSPAPSVPPRHVHLNKSETIPPTIPILEGTFWITPTIQAGERGLELEWFGGKPPYQLQINLVEKAATFSWQDETVLWQKETSAQVVKTEKIQFKAGQHYRLVIAAANFTKQPSQFEFEAVANLPEYPNPLQDKTLPDNLRRTLQAGWLAKQDRIQWAFEAYQQIFEIVKDYGPARELQQGLIPDSKAHAHRYTQVKSEE